MSEELTVVAVDAMGGDNAPGELVKGAVNAVKDEDNIKVILVGKEDAIKKELGKYEYDENKIEIRNATEIIATDEVPTIAVRRKKDSSLVVAMKMVKQGEADAVVSAGSSGAILVGGQAIVGRIKGIDRPPLAPLIPTSDGVALLIDCGANVDARSSHLVQFAQLGSIYMEYVMGVKNPRVGLLNIGAEEEKGNSLTKETYPLLKELDNINFIGNVEAREIPEGAADVIVCDAFAGNCILKFYEGVGNMLKAKLTSVYKKSAKNGMGYLMVKKDLNKTLKAFKTDEYGGAPLLGLNGLVVKTHGSAKAIEVCTSIKQCVTFKQQHIKDRVTEHIAVK